MKKYFKKTFKKRRASKVHKYTPKYTSSRYLSLTTKQLYNPIPQVFRVRLIHEQDYASPVPPQLPQNFAVRTYVKSAVSARGLDIGVDNPVGTAWTYPAGMKSMHCLYSLSWVESIKVTATVMLTSNTASVNCVFFKGNGIDYAEFVDGAGIQGAVGMDDNRYDSVRSRPDSVSLTTSRRDGGNPMCTHTYSVENSKICKDFDENLAYATYSDRTGQMGFPQGNILQQTPFLGILVRPVANEIATTYWIRWKVEYNMKFSNLHPLQSRNNIAHVN